MSTYTKNLFIAPHAHGNTLRPDLTQLPANMRDVLQRPDPVREGEAVGHLLTSTQPISAPAARIRAQIDPESAPGAPRRVSIYGVDAEGRTRLVQIYLDRDQAKVLHASIGSALASLEPLDVA